MDKHERKLIIGDEVYRPWYKFDGGEYFVPENPIHGAESWVALMDDGHLELLFNGVHRPYNTEYTLEG